MKQKDINKQFIEKFKNEFQNFKIIKFTNVSSEIIVEDENGFKYRKSTCFKIFGHKFNIHSIIDKGEFVKFKILERHPNIKIIKFSSIKEPLIIEDESGVKYEKTYYQILKTDFNIQSVIDKREYIESKIKEIFPKLNVIEYRGMKEKILVEDENGFKYTPQCYDLLQGNPVTIQTCTEKEKLFEFNANKIHNNFYKYPDFKYINGKQKINIKCIIHGEFEQIIESHLIGHGCKKCTTVGFSKESWLKRLKNKNAYFYVLRVFNNDEEFIKIGITSVGVDQRYKYLKNYKFEVLDIIEDSPSKIYDIEKKILQKYKNYKYLPKLPFEGWSECLDINSLNKLKNYGYNICE